MTTTERLQLVARFERNQGIELDGPTAGLARLADLLSRGDGVSCDLVVPVGLEARPYDGFLTRLQLENTSGPVRVYRHDETLRIQGCTTGFKTLSENIKFLFSSTGGSGASESDHRHIHVEYYEDHPYLSKETEPLTIVLVRPPGCGTGGEIF